MHKFDTKRFIRVVAVCVLALPILGVGFTSTAKESSYVDTSYNQEPNVVEEITYIFPTAGISTTMSEIMSTVEDVLSEKESEDISNVCDNDTPMVAESNPTEVESIPETTEEEVVIVPDYSVIPLDQELVEVLIEECNTYGVDLHIALGVIYVESRFNVNAKAPNSSCYGLMQLHAKYFPADLDPAGNIHYGIMFLGSLLEKYDGDYMTALNVYNAGHPTGNMRYSNKVMKAAEDWLPIITEANILMNVEE